ncbi:MAG: Uncharacterised protein [Flavobacteriaceae bacterium]|nr:MAG: Uncharacterised protein [Flavobacteriaceae bacterium]
MSLKLVCIHCPTEDSFIKLTPPKKLGTNMIACAKMIGITPEAFNFNGMNCLAPKIFFSYAPEAVLRAYCTGIFRTAITKRTLSKMITNQITSSIRTSINEDEASS